MPALSSTLETLDLDIGVTSWRQGTYEFRAEEKSEIERDREEERKAGEKEEDMTREYVEKGEEPFQVLLRGILGKLEGLVTLSVDLESGNTYARNEETGKYDVHPQAMNGEELVRLFLFLVGIISLIDPSPELLL